MCNLMSFQITTFCRSLHFVVDDVVFRKIFWLFAFEMYFRSYLSHNKASQKTISEARECFFIRRKSLSQRNFSFFSLSSDDNKLKFILWKISLVILLFQLFYLPVFTILSFSVSMEDAGAYSKSGDDAKALKFIESSQIKDHLFQEESKVC